MTAMLKTEKSALILHDLDIEIVSLIEKCVNKVDKEKLKKNMRTLLIIEPISDGYLINITNIPNQKELNYLKYWLF